MFCYYDYISAKNIIYKTKKLLYYAKYIKIWQCPDTGDISSKVG